MITDINQLDFNKSYTYALKGKYTTGDKVTVDTLPGLEIVHDDVFEV